MRYLTKISNSIAITNKQIQAKLKDQCLVYATTRALYRISRDSIDQYYEYVSELVTINTQRLYPVPSLKGERYALFLINNATYFIQVSFFKVKSKITQLLLDTF